MIIPIGVDCGMADFCKKYNLRSYSFPFDWAVSYNGVSACFEDRFQKFIPGINERINTYDVYFHHDFKPETREEDTLKYLRRIERLHTILETTEEPIIFCRKGHAGHHHLEHNGNYETITSDIEDAERLDSILSTMYPKLNYKIIVILVCGNCFDPTIVYKSVSPTIEIYNMAMPHIDDTIFESLARTIFKV